VKSMKRSLQCVVGLVSAMAGLTARADFVVDQSYIAPPGNLGSVLAEGYAFVGQTATTSITGDLVAVELNASRRSNFLTPWVLDIQRVINGVPTGEVLSSTTVAPNDFYSGTLFGAPSVPLPLRIDLSTPVFFKASDPFAIVLHPQGVTGTPNLFAGQWEGNPTDDYAGGTAVFGQQANALTPQAYDLHFRTLVNPVPEPASIVLLSIGSISVLALARHRLKASADPAFQESPDQSPLQIAMQIAGSTWFPQGRHK
jgi:hypothetical protein